MSIRLSSEWLLIELKKLQETKCPDVPIGNKKPEKVHVV